MSFAQCRWLGEPAVWNVGDGRPQVVTDAGTDFWRRTRYGFVRDNGHSFAYEAAGDLTAQLRAQARYNELYDQAGIMVRVDDSNWLRAGIAEADGQASLGSVLAVGQSDWATGPYAGDPADFWIRVTVRQGVLRAQVSSYGQSWPLSLLAPFPQAATYLVGPMRCTPERAGLAVDFSAFRVGPPVDESLHDLP